MYGLPPKPVICPMAEGILRRALVLDENEHLACEEENLDQAVNLLDSSMDDAFQFIKELADMARLLNLE